MVDDQIDGKKTRTLEEAAEIDFEAQLPLWNMLKADEKADKKGERPEDLVDTDKPEDAPEPPPEPLGISPTIKNLPFKNPAGLKTKPGKINLYKWPIKPVPEAVKIEKIYEILSKWDAWGIKKVHKPYFICTFLFAGRASEMLEARQQDFEILNISGQEFLQGRFLTLKTRGGNMIRNPVVPFKGLEEPMVEEFANYLNNFSPRENLFDLDRKTAWHQMHKINYGPLTALKVENGKKSFVRMDDWWGTNHYLRHCRASDLVRRWHFSILNLQQFIGWQDVRMASRYVHLDVQDIANAFMKN